MDRIVVSSVPIVARLGVLPDERAMPQKLLLDLSLELDLEPAGNTDNLSLTVDYRKLVNHLQTVAGQASCVLLEALALRLCRAALEDPKATSVTVRVCKFPVELAGQADHVAVEMTRTR